MTALKGKKNSQKTPAKIQQKLPRCDKIEKTISQRGKG